MSKNVDRIKLELGNQPEIAERVIDYLNGRFASELQVLNISDRTCLIMEDKRVLSKLDLATPFQKQCATITRSNKAFKDRFQPCFNAGLPSFWGESGALYKKQSYDILFATFRSDQNKFEGMPETLARIVLVEYLSLEFDLLHIITIEFQHVPIFSYTRYTELDMAGRAMNSYQYPTR